MRQYLLRMGRLLRAWPSGKASAFQADIRGSESRRPLWSFTTKGTKSHKGNRIFFVFLSGLRVLCSRNLFFTRARSSAAERTAYSSESKLRCGLLNMTCWIGLPGKQFSGDTCQIRGSLSLAIR